MLDRFMRVAHPLPRRRGNVAARQPHVRQRPAVDVPRGSPVEGPAGGRPCAARGRRCSICPSTGPEPRVASDLPAGRRGVAAEHQTDPADAGAVADLDPDDLAFLFRQARTCSSHRCDIPSDWLSGQSPI